MWKHRIKVSGLAFRGLKKPKTSPTLFQVLINDMLKVVEALRQGIQLGGSEVSGLLFADELVGDVCYSEGLEQQLDAAVDFARKWRPSANIKKLAVRVCNDSPVEEVDIK